MTILALLSAAVLAVCGPTRADTPGPENDVEKAVLWLTRESPRHPVQRDPEWRRRLSSEIAASATENGIPPLFWAGVAFRESSFKTHARGALGEVGLVQVHGAAAKGCDLSTSRGQLDCGARWLARCVARCGSLRGGFARYASGRVCRPDNRHLHRVVENRIKLWQKLERLVTDGKT